MSVLPGSPAVLVVSGNPSRRGRIPVGGRFFHTGSAESARLKTFKGCAVRAIYSFKVLLGFKYSDMLVRLCGFVSLSGVYLLLLLLVHGLIGLLLGLTVQGVHQFDASGKWRATIIAYHELNSGVQGISPSRDNEE